MTMDTLRRQASRPGPVLCHYRVTGGRGYKLSRNSHVWLFSFVIGNGHGFAIGWTRPRARG